MSESYSARISAKRIQVSAAAMAVAATTALAPVIVPTVSHAAPILTAAPVLTWGYDQLDAALIATDNDNGSAATTVTPGASAVGATPTPAELLQYLVTGIARGVVDIVGTPVYVAVAFTGLVFTTVGTFIPFLAPVGAAINNAANSIAAALRVGPYGTSA